MKLITLIFVSLVMSACSTFPITFDSATSPDQSHIYPLGNKLSEEFKDCATVRFVRDKGFTGSACTSVIKVNGEKAFALDPGNAYTIYIAPGEYFFTREFGAGLCPNVEISQNATLRAGQEQVYRLSTDSNMQSYLTRVK